MMTLKLYQAMRGTNMTKESPLRALLVQLNQEFALSEEFKVKVLDLIQKLEGFDLRQEQLEALSLKVRETYQRQMLVESYRGESQKSLEKIQNSITAFSSALNNINEKLNQAESALENLVQPKSSAMIPVEQNQRRDNFLNKERAKAFVAFATINSKNSRIN
jgi:septal ring factor EnvC (AmiA/AmiB activator)